MRKYNKFLILLLCISLSFLVSCMNEQEKETDATENGVLTDAVITEAPVTEALPQTSALAPVNSEGAPKTDTPAITDVTPAVTTATPTTALPLTTAPLTSAPVTTKGQNTVPNEPSDEYLDEILMDIMYLTDGDGKWAGFGKYIKNFEVLDSDVSYSLESRSKSAYNEVASVMSLEEAEKTVADIYNEFKSDIKLILRVKGIEFTVHDVLGYEILKLQ